MCGGDAKEVRGSRSRHQLHGAMTPKNFRPGSTWEVRTLKKSQALKRNGAPVSRKNRHSPNEQRPFWGLHSIPSTSGWDMCPARADRGAPKWLHGGAGR